MQNKLALHTWTLDTTPLEDALRIARKVGWDAVELRRVDFVRASEAGGSAGDVIKLVRDSRLEVAAVGVEAGWLFADGEERQRLFRVMAESCQAASELGSRVIMSAVGPGRGALEPAAANVRHAGDIVGEYGLGLAVEFNSQGEQINTLESARELLALAKHPNCRLLLDTYHLERSGRGGRGFEEIAPDELLYFQYSDVPRSGLEPGKAINRLPPGQGSVRFREVFQLLAEKGYSGYLSYEAPNPAAWARDPEEVAREALEATRAALPA